jgi:hypothetical protein
MADARLAFFTQTIEALHGTRDFDGPEALSSFLDDPSVLVLRACLLDSGRVVLTTTVEGPVPGSKSEAAFVKRAPCSISAGTLSKDVQVIAAQCALACEVAHEYPCPRRRYFATHGATAPSLR